MPTAGTNKRENRTTGVGYSYDIGNERNVFRISARISYSE